MSAKNCIDAALFKGLLSCKMYIHIHNVLVDIERHSFLERHETLLGHKIVISDKFHPKVTVFRMENTKNSHCLWHEKSRIE